MKVQELRSGEIWERLKLRFTRLIALCSQLLAHVGGILAAENN